MAIGKTVQVIVAIVDVEFPKNYLPCLFSALEVQNVNKGKNLILDIQQHLGSSIVRAVAMDYCYGLRCGLKVKNLYHHIEVLVGKATLSCIVNVLGQTTDMQGNIGAEES